MRAALLWWLADAGAWVPPDHYAALGLRPGEGTTVFDVRKAYRQAALKNKTYEIIEHF